MRNIDQDWLKISIRPPESDLEIADPLRRGGAPKHPACIGDLLMWLLLMWLQFDAVRGPVGVDLGPKELQTGPKSILNDPDRTWDNLKLQM